MPAARLLQRYWSKLGDAQLRAALDTARAALDAFTEVVSDRGSLIQSWVRGAPMRPLEHYPDDDIVDLRSGSQFFYHAHRSHGSEHGHLHLFWHATSSGRRRYVAGRERRWVRAAPSHLLAIGLDSRGLPVSMFTVNRWVTDGYWFDAAATLAMLDRFDIRNAGEHAASGRWLSGFVRLYRPVAAELLERRDRRLARHGALEHALDERRLEVPSQFDLDWAADLDTLQALCRQRGVGAAAR